MKQKQKKINIFIGLLSIVSIGLVATTLTSCSGVSSKITSNMVNKGDGSKFSATTPLQDEVKEALMDKDASAAFKKVVADKVLYQWYYTLKADKSFRDQTTFTDNWDQWTKDAKTSYDDKVKSYKSDHGTNWQYYFQNEVLDPIGANGQLINPTTGAKESAKDTYVRFQMYEKIRTDFDNRVFANDYLSLPSATFDPANPLSAPTQNHSGDTKGEAVDELLLTHPENWQNIDFYPSAHAGYDKDHDIDWEYAYIQHIAFLEYTMSVKPVSSSMILWKGYSGDDATNKFKEMYNVYDATNNPSGVVPTDAKVGYNYPLFSNDKFTNFMTDGFTDTSSSARANFFFDHNDYAKDTTLSSNLINIPVKNDGGRIYGDDSSNLIKVNLGSDVFTTLDVTFGAAVSDLWSAMKDGTAIDANGKLLPMYRGTYTSGTQNYLPNQSDIIKNFLYSDGAGSDNPLPTQFISAAQTLGKLTSTATATGGELCQKITNDVSGNHAEIFNHNSDWYKKNYTDVVSAFQLSKSDGSTVTPLPYVLIRERSGGSDGTGGVHLIGLDGTGYLADTNNYAGTAYSQTRENGILKYRALSNIWGDARYASGMNFIDSDLKTYFTSNESLIVLELANKMTDVTYYDGGAVANNLSDDYNNWVAPYGKGNIFSFPPKQYNDALWQSLVKISMALDALQIYEGVITNFSTSFDKLKAFNATETTNLKFAGADGPVQEQAKYKTNDVYKNGLASKFSFAASRQTSGSFAGTAFNVQKYLITPSTAISATFPASPSSLQANVFGTAYQTFNTEISNNYVGKAKSGIAQYSEHITTKMDEVNTMLNTFGGSNNFTNNFLLKAYQQFLNQGTTFLDNDGYFNTDLSDSIDGSVMNQVLGSNLYVPKVVAAASDMNKLTTNPNDLSADGNLTNAALAYWKNGNAINNGWGFNDGTTSNIGYASDKIDYYKSLAAIKYLLTNRDGDFDPTNFIQYQTQQLKYGSVYDFIWTTHDSVDYQDTTVGNNFGTIAANNTNALNLYKFKNNYGNVFDGRLSNLGNDGSTDITSDDFVNTTFADNADYLKFASNNSGVQLMGYKGMVGSGSSLPSPATEALVNDFVSGNPMTDGTGALYQYHALGNFIDIDSNTIWDGTSMKPIGQDILNSEAFKNSLTGYIYNNRSNLGVVQGIAKTIQNSITGFSAANGAIDTANQINPYTGAYYDPAKDVPSKITAQALISLISADVQYKQNDTYYKNLTPTQKTVFDNLHWSDGSLTNALKPIYFTGINTNGAKELLNKNHPNDLSAAVFLDSNENTACTRVLFEQIRNTDLLPIDEDGNIANWEPVGSDNYKTQCLSVWNNLLTKFGKSLIYDLVYKAAQNSSNATKANNLVRELFNNANGKLVVYDRRYNDQLGYNWVKDYKDKN